MLDLPGPSHFREALRLSAARRRLVQIGQFLAELDPLAVFEAHGNAHLRYPAVDGGDFAVDHNSLEGRSLADELVTLGLGDRLLVLMTMKQCELSSGGCLTRQYSTCGPGSHSQSTDRSALTWLSVFGRVAHVAGYHGWQHSGGTSARAGRRHFLIAPTPLAAVPKRPSRAGDPCEVISGQLDRKKRHSAALSRGTVPPLPVR